MELFSQNMHYFWCVFSQNPEFCSVSYVLPRFFYCFLLPFPCGFFARIERFKRAAWTRNR